MQKLTSYCIKGSKAEYRLGKEVVYIDPGKTFSVVCKVIGFGGNNEVVLAPVAEPRKL
jgi:hypothetical protein